MSGAAEEIVGYSRSLRRVLDLTERFAPTALPILLVGETGTGKELLAERIHQASGRAGPLITVNCGALPRDMIESLLFGHRKGAFTGAAHDTTGFVAAADGGTLFLDELPSLPIESQVKLLRFLESHAIQRLGDTVARRVDFRVVAAAQNDLRALVAAGAFRLDLFERVAGVVLRLDPLRDRPEDIVPLARYFAARQGRSLEPGTTAVLLNYAWPGNVRELRSAIERAGILCENGTLEVQALVDAIGLGASMEHDGEPARKEGPRPPVVDCAEHARTVLACEQSAWDVSRAAQVLGVGRSTLYRRLRLLGLSTRAGRAAIQTTVPERSFSSSVRML